jgi:hypothetical protein
MSDEGWTKLRLVIDLEYHPETAHGDEPEAVQWFKDMLSGNALWLSDFGDWGDVIGKVRVVEGLDALASHGGQHDRD